ncbi:MAG: hypothetical protein U0807_14840 [Candidatus Binatia bacterium]
MARDGATAAPAELESLVAEAHAAEQAGDLGTASARLEVAVAAAPGLEPLHVLLSSLHAHAGRMDAAATDLERAFALGHRDAYRLRRALLLPPILRSVADARTARQTYAQRLAALATEPLAIADPLADVPYLNFYLAYQGENDRDLNRRLATIVRRACPSLTFEAPHVGRRPRDRPRVGFLSTHFRDHTIGHLNDGILRHLSAEEIDTVLLLVDGETDGFSEHMATGAGTTVRLPRDLAAARARIAALELDVLHFADIGMDPFTWFLAFARLAPVQCTTWGHPVTTGIDTVDWFLSHADLETDPAGGHYSERLLLLDRLNLCSTRPLAPHPLPDRAALGLPDGGTVYICPQTLFKLHPDLDPALGAILAGDRGSWLVLVKPRYREWETLFLDRLAAHVPDVASRVVFVPPLSRPRFLALLARADVMLDPFHFGGGHTSLEALAMGTPVVTWSGAFLRGRLTHALYQRMGTSTGTTVGPDAWVARALALGTDPAARAKVRREILERSAALFDDRAAVQAFAAGLRRMLRGYW